MTSTDVDSCISAVPELKQKLPAYQNMRGFLLNEDDSKDFGVQIVLLAAYNLTLYPAPDHTDLFQTIYDTCLIEAQDILFGQKEKEKQKYNRLAGLVASIWKFAQ